MTSEHERLTRELILQMKLGDLELSPLREKFGVDPLETFSDAFERLEDQGMLEVENGDRVVLSREGLLQVDGLLANFYDDSYRSARYT